MTTIRIKKKPYAARKEILIPLTLLLMPLAFSQSAEEEESEIFELSPFTVEASEDQGYRATSTMAGTRIRTDLKDVGSAISVVTAEFLRDTGAVDNETLLKYTVSTETGGIGGSFGGSEQQNLLNPNANNRVRGLTSADNTRDYFTTDIPWDGYNVSRVDLQRGPNSILSGLGSPAGIINNSTIGAVFDNDGEVQVRFGSYGSRRLQFRLNKVILEDELAVRLAAVDKHDKFRQQEAWSEDSRLYLALKYDPRFLQSETMVTSLSGNFESGDIESNRPRSRPPVDQLTAWWNEYTDGNGVTWPSQIVAHPLAFTGTSQLPDGSLPPGPVLSDGSIGQNISFNNPYYSENYTDGPILYFGNQDQGDGNPTYFSVPGIPSTDANVVFVDPDGNISQDSGGTNIPFYRSVQSVSSTAAAALALGRPLAQFGGYGPEYIFDRSIFDYKNHLLDGANKSEFQEFEAVNLKLSQTFWGNRLGYEVAIDRQDYLSGQESPFGWQPSITIDTNTHLADFAPNPNVGRAAIFSRTQGSANSTERLRESRRATVFAELREGDLFESDTFLGKLIGKQRVTALRSGDDLEFKSLGWKNWLPGNDYRSFVGVPDVTNNQSEIMAAVYLSGDLRNTASPQGLNLSPLTKLNPTAATSIRTWDSNWDPSNPLTVDYLQSQWVNPWTVPAFAPGVDTEGVFPYQNQIGVQENNPSNYVGWVDRPISVYTSDSGHRDELYTSSASQYSEVRSEAFVWQGFFWDSAIVPTYGYRKDEQLAYSGSAPRSNDPLLANPDARSVYLPGVQNPNYTDSSFLADNPGTHPLYGVPDPVYEGSTESWSVVLHTAKFLPELPLNTKISLFYNESSNFQPGQKRVDHLNQPLSPPSGETTDWGFLVSTFEDKVSLKVNFYENTIEGASFNPGNLWYLGTAETSLFSAAMRDNAFLQDTPGWNDSWRGYANSPYQAGDAPWENYLDEMGEASRDQTVEEALAWQQRAVGAAIENIAPDEFWNAWGATQSDQRWQSGWWDPWNETTGAQPVGFTSTSDLISKGTEIELSLRPTDNWNIAINAAKTEATRDNIAGSLKEWVEARNLVHNSDAGDVRLWWSGDRNNTLKTRWNSAFYSTYQLALQQEGQTVSELREWRFNLVTNYKFSDGMFKGVNLGGSYRWEDEVGIGYPQFETVSEAGNRIIGYDIDNPIMGPSESHFDLWAGYEFKLNDSLDWRIQLNVRDVFAEGGLIATSVQPDGTIATYRLEADPTWSLSNTISF